MSSASAMMSSSVLTLKRVEAKSFIPSLGHPEELSQRQPRSGGMFVALGPPVSSQPRRGDMNALRPYGAGRKFVLTSVLQTSRPYGAKAKADPRTVLQPFSPLVP